MIDLVIAAGVGFICGCFLTISIIAFCTVAMPEEEEKDDEKL